MIEGKSGQSLARTLIIQYLTISLFCYLFINLAFFLVLSPLIPNLLWGSLAYTGSEPAFIRWTIFTLRFYIALIPFFITTTVGLWWLMQTFDPDPPIPTRLFWGNLAGLAIALPLLLQLPYFMASLAFDPEFAASQAWLWSIPIFVWTVLLYLLVVSTITASHPFAHIKHLFLNPLFWLLFVILILHAYFAFIGLVLIDLSLIPLVSILLTVLIPLLLLCFTSLAHTKIYQNSEY